jgi:formylglycine-generating enzyme required for sulfatase activity
VAAVSVSPATASLTVGGTQQLTASARDANGNPLTGRAVTWSSGTTAVANVSSSGVATAVAVGSATITATVEGVTGTAAVTVTGGAFSGNFVLINPGSFLMGSTNGDSDERPVRTVTLTRAFRLQTTEVTQGQWQAVMGSNPSFFTNCGPTCPVEQVSWDDVQQFLARLNAQDPGKGYRLPTEAEWEYAARAGTTGDFGGNGVVTDMGWIKDISGGRPQPVGQKRANAWGLHDLHGNVWEWVQDWFASDYYERGVNTDPPGPATGNRRVVRGGSWSGIAVNARSASRDDPFPDSRYSNIGFRLARTP